SQSGNSCLLMSRFRSKVEVLGVSNSIKVMRKMCLYWGITPYFFQETEEDMSVLQDKMISQLKKEMMVTVGDKVVITHGDGKFFKQGSSNSLRVEIIKDLSRNPDKTSHQDALIEEGTRLGK